MPEMIQGPTEWASRDLYERLAKPAAGEGESAGNDLFILDVRAEDEFARRKIEGRREIPALNIPYFEMLEVEEEGEDLAGTFKAFLAQGTADRLPRDRPVLVVCAKGDTSEYVAEALRRMGFEALSLAGGMVAWGDYYRSETIVEDSGLTVVQVSRPARGCLSYVVARGGEAAVIDPLRHIDRYLGLAASLGCEIHLVLDTHGHADHLSGGPALAATTGAPYFLHPYDGIHPIDVLPATIAYEFVSDGRSFALGDSELQALHIPGHTLGNVAYLLDGKYLFSGDSIFLESIARPDLGGRGDTWAPIHYRSLRRLLTLPGETVVLPGHFSSLAECGDAGFFAAPLEELAKANEGLRIAAGTEQEFVDYILASLPEFPEEYIEIKRVNAGLRQADEALASELELGKNICALAQAYEASA